MTTTFAFIQYYKYVNFRKKTLAYLLLVILLSCNYIGHGQNRLTCEGEGPFAYIVTPTTNRSRIVFKEAKTKFFFDRRNLGYLNYWPIGSCDLDEVEQLLLDKFNGEGFELLRNDEVIIFQFFPFVNRDGHLLLGVTASRLSERAFLNMCERMMQDFRSMYDDNKNYKLLIYDYTSREIVDY